MGESMSISGAILIAIGAGVLAAVFAVPGEQIASAAIGGALIGTGLFHA